MPIPIPYDPTLWGFPINVHLVLEYAAFIVGYRYYVYLKQRSADRISSGNRSTIIIGAALGALIGSRVFGWLEHPAGLVGADFMTIMNAKTIMGGLFGGLVGVEWTKKLIGEKESSGDLFTFPIILGLIIGRVGCFLSGVNEFTYGSPTASLFGMDLGDGVLRHPIALYEIVFLVALFWFLRVLQRRRADLPSGALFQYFMVAYFGFRFGIEFLKPNEFFVLGLSSIQYLCLVCLGYYGKVMLIDK
ncbi:prolipoprotein diacylglyceryl transferase [Lewinella sp. W8]|uniref:prolipoprotein diacylglyceryl transferase n=1 Tax=Lewinella sp. W8 TaxID=2528208 RepID=UPI0012B59F4A|nr:prolipoprotein diacylglyceryl transferase family protein [Lewinella sp. W8]